MQKETVAPWWKKPAVNTNTPAWQELMRRLPIEGGRWRPRCRRGSRAEPRLDWVQAAAPTSRHRLVKPSGRSHRQMLLFFHDNDCPAKRLAASRSFEHPLTSKPPLGAAPTAAVPIRRTHKALWCNIMQFLQRVDIPCYRPGWSPASNVFLFPPLPPCKFMLGNAACGHQTVATAETRAPITPQDLLKIRSPAGANCR